MQLGVYSLLEIYAFCGVHCVCACLVQAVFFGTVALMALRMKFFWTPYMCIIASVSLANRSLWAWLLSQLRCHSELAVGTLVQNLEIVHGSINELILKLLPVIFFCYVY